MVQTDNPSPIRAPAVYDMGLQGSRKSALNQNTGNLYFCFWSIDEFLDMHEKKSHQRLYNLHLDPSQNYNKVSPAEKFASDKRTDHQTKMSPKFFDPVSQSKVFALVYTLFLTFLLVNTPLPCFLPAFCCQASQLSS